MIRRQCYIGFKPLVFVLLTSVLLLAVVVTIGRVVHAGENHEPEFSDAEVALVSLFGPWPVNIPADPGNEYSGVGWVEELGEQLFSDTDLSGAGDLACIACHQPDQGFAENRRVAVGAEPHVRNTQGLLNSGLQRWFGWDGGADSLWAASLRPILSEIEMAANIPDLATRFRTKPYVLQAIADSNQAIDVVALTDEQFVVFIAKAIAAYTRTLVSGETPFDRFRTALTNRDQAGIDAYSDSARRGLKIFLGEANCHVCHFGPNFSNGEFHDTGRPFFIGTGQVDPGRHSGIQRVRKDKYNLSGEYNGTLVASEIRKTETVKLGQNNFGEWRTPSLRNLTTTAPYMHDGSLATLRDVVQAYSNIDPDRLHTDGESILKPLGLGSEEVTDLVSFLRSLSVSPGG